MADRLRPAGARHATAVYGRALSAHLRSIVEYPADFWIMAASGAMWQILQFAFLTVLFANVPSLGGWSYYEVMLLVAFLTTTAGANALLADGFWSTGELVVGGDIDYRITRPAPVMAQVASLHVGMQGTGEVTLGAVMFVVGWIGAGLSPALLPLAALFLVCGLIIQASILAIACAANFWIKGRASVFAMLVVDLQGNAMRMPLNIFPTAVRTFATFVVPMAFINFVPVEVLTGRSALWWTAGPPIAAFATAALAVLVYRLALRVYESAGH